MNRVYVALLVCFVFFVTGCQNTNQRSGPAPDSAAVPPAVSTPEAESAHEAQYRKISAGEAKEMMDGSQEYILLDVRTDEEYAESRIDGAVLIPDYEIGVRAENELPDKGALILVYCRSGRRSANAANELVNSGYTNVYDFGGITDWPYDTVSGD